MQALSDMKHMTFEDIAREGTVTIPSDSFSRRRNGNSLLFCPHCGLRISGSRETIISRLLDEHDLVDWAISCPRCGRTIRKMDVD